MAQKQLTALPQAVAVEEDDVLLLRKTFSSTDEKLRLDTLRPALLQDGLVSFALLATEADRYAYTTGENEWAEGFISEDARTLLAMPSITEAGRDLLDDADVEEQLETLGISELTGRNAIINGNFDIWQRGTSQTGTGYGSDDRWDNDSSGSTKVASRQDFALGQTDVPGEPKHFSRTVVSSVAGAGNYVVKEQRVEGVRTFAGQLVTLSFYAKADAAKDIAVELKQRFGSGGSPSATVDEIGAQKLALTTAWQKFTVTITLPSISGKTIGTDSNDYFGLTFWFDAGSDFDARTDFLGQQSGIFDIAQVQLEAGTVATPFEKRSIGQEFALCQRYYEEGTFFWQGHVYTSTAIGGSMQFAVRKAVNPSFNITVGNTNNFTGNVQFQAINKDSVSLNAGVSSGSAFFFVSWRANAEL